MFKSRSNSHGSHTNLSDKMSLRGRSCRTVKLQIDFSPVGLHDNVISELLISWYHCYLTTRCDIGCLTDHCDVWNHGSQREWISLQVDRQGPIPICEMHQLERFKITWLECLNRRVVEILAQLRHKATCLTAFLWSNLNGSCQSFNSL